MRVLQINCDWSSHATAAVVLLFIVGRNESFEVADHDFTKFGIIPSVSVSVSFRRSLKNHGMMAVCSLE